MSGRYSAAVPHRVWTRAALSVVSCVLLAGCAATGGAGSSSPESPSHGPASVVGVTTYPVGQRPTIPDLSGATLDGRTLALSSLRGQVVVLNVWASWCDPCRAESPTLARVARDTASSGVRFVGVDEQDRPDSARAFAASAGTTYPHLVDSDGTLLSSLRLVPSSGIPSTLVIDGSGAVAARVIGPVDASTFEGVVRAVVGTGSRPS
jgi:thiol-disulfide isomerase/thioredoxin